MKKTMLGPWPWPWPPSLKLKLLHVFSVKLPASSSCSSSSSTCDTKLKTLIHTLIFSFTYRIAPFFSKSKSVILCIITQHKPISFINHCRVKISNKKKNRKLLFGSFRLHYNWSSSSHVIPAPESFSYDSIGNSFVYSEENSNLSGYLQWLEEKELNEIDRMAELFIAKSHEKFLLEKQESYRRFQEMLAGSS